MDETQDQNQVPTPPVVEPITPPEQNLGGIYDITDLGGESRWDKIKYWFSDLFADRKKVIIFSAAFLVLVAGIIAILAIRGGSDKVSETPAATNDRGQLPLADEIVPDFLPTVYRPGNGTIVVEWTMDRPTDGRVDYGLSQEYGYFVDDPNTLHQSVYSDVHRVIIQDLDSTLTYHLLASSVDLEGRIAYSGNIVVKPVADTNAPTVAFAKPTNGQTVGGITEVCADIMGQTDLVSLTLLLDGTPIAQTTRNFSDCYNMDTRAYANGSYGLSWVVSDGSLTGRANIRVNFDNTTNAAGNGRSKVGWARPIGSENGGGSGTGENGGNNGGNNGSNEGSDDDTTSWEPCSTVTRNITANIKSPVAGASVSGDLLIDAEASGSNIKTVRFFVDGSWYLGEALSAPYRLHTDTRMWSDGSHTISAVAVNTSVACSSPANVRVTSKNYNQKPTIGFVSVQRESRALTVTWETSVEADSYVEYDNDFAQRYRSNKSDAALKTDHSLRLDNLQEDTVYYLLIRSKTGDGVQADPVAVSARTTASGQASCSIVGADEFNGCYFNELDFNDYVFSLPTDRIDFSWAAGSSPDAQIAPTNYSVIWQGAFDFSGTTEFTLTANDGAKLYADGALIVDAWSGADNRKVNANLTGRKTIKLEYQQKEGDARVALSWRSIPVGCSSLGEGNVITLTKPTANEILAGDYEVAATASQAVAKVNFYIGGELIGEDTSAPYTATLQTFKYDNGRYTVSALGADANGNCVGGENNSAEIVIRNEQFSIFNVQSWTSDIAACIDFDTTEPSTSVIRYGESRDASTWPAANQITLNGQTTTVGECRLTAENKRAYITGLESGDDDGNAGKVYYFKISSTSAVNSDRKAETQVLNFTTLPKPTNTNLTASVSWQDSCGLTGRVYYSRYPVPATGLSGSGIASVTAASTPRNGACNYTAIISGLYSNTLYYYRYSPAGTSTVSALKEFTTPAN